MSTVLAKMAVQISANTAEFAKGINQANQHLAGFQKGLSALSRTAGILGVGFASFQIGRQVLQSFAQFQYEMSKVKAITQATEKEFNDLRNNAIKLASTFGVEAKAVASLQLELGRLGFSTKEILNTTKSIVLLSKATGEDLSRSAEITGSVLRAFNLDAAESGRVTDVMAAAFNKTALGLSDFGEAMKYVAPVAAAAGLSIEQVSSMLGVLADSGIKGSMAGTSLRKIISDLGAGAAPQLTKKLSEMAAAGITGAAAMDEVGRTAYASLLVLSKNTEKIDANRMAFEKSNGELQKMSDIMTDNLIGDWDKLTGAVDSFFKKIGEGKDGVLRATLQDASALVKLLGHETLGWTQKLGIAVGNITGKGINEDIEAWEKKVAEAIENIEKRHSLLAQKMINGYELSASSYSDAIQKAIDDVNKVIEQQGGKKGTWYGGMITSGELLDALTKKLTESQKNLNKSLSKTQELEVNQIDTIKEMEAEIKRLNEEIDNTNVLDIASIRANQLLVKEYQARIDAIRGVIKASKELTKHDTEKFTDHKSPEFSGQDGSFSFNKDSLSELDRQQQETLDRLRNFNQSAWSEISSFAEGSLAIIGQRLGDSTVNVGKGLLMGLGKFLASFGRQLIALGVGAKGLQAIVKNPLNPGAAVAAIVGGAALIVAGNAIAANASKGISSAVGGGGGGSSYSVSQPQLATNAAQNEFSYTIQIRGQDLWVALKNYNENKGRTSAIGG